MLLDVRSYRVPQNQGATVKHPEPINLELAIRAIEHEKIVGGLTNATSQWQAGYDSGWLAGMDHAIETLRNLDAAGRIEDPEGAMAAKVDAALRLAANVCDDFAQRAKTDRERAINREDSATLAREQSTAMACRDAILALLGERGGKQ